MEHNEKNRDLLASGVLVAEAIFLTVTAFTAGYFANEAVEVFSPGTSKETEGGLIGIVGGVVFVIGGVIFGKLDYQEKISPGYWERNPPRGD